jgi:hypothetical protein
MAILLYIVAGGLAIMTQTTAAPDPQFVRALHSQPSGIYYRDVDHFSSEKVATEFRKAVGIPELLADQDFMANVLFLIRKREIRALRDDVGQLVSSRSLQPRAAISALKTLTAIGGPDALSLIDRRYSELLNAALKDPKIQPDVLPWAERVGGPETLALLTKALSNAEAEQRSAERAEHPDFGKISQLDRVRSSLENQQAVLRQKLEISAAPEPGRTQSLVQLYLRRVGHLAFWSYKELVDHPSTQSADAIRAFLANSIQTMIPKTATGEARSELIQDLRLRGLCLLQTMKQATPQEIEYIQAHSARIDPNTAFYRPAYDWEDVLDRT